MQVLRWGALVTGVFYGFTHQSAIRSSDKKAAEKHDWERKVKLIDDAKAEYKRKSEPQSGDGGKHIFLQTCVGLGGGGVSWACNGWSGSGGNMGVRAVC